MNDVEEISINKDSISHINSCIPSIPFNGIQYRGLSGAQLPNRDLVICGGDTSFYFTNHQYLHYKEGSNHWRKVGTMKKTTIDHSSVWIDGRLLTTGCEQKYKQTSHHEEFSFDGGVKARKEMPVERWYHTATIFGQNRIIVCGGEDRSVSQTFSN